MVGVWGGDVDGMGWRDHDGRCADGWCRRRVAGKPGQRPAVRRHPVGDAPGRRAAVGRRARPRRRPAVEVVGGHVHAPHAGDRRQPPADADAAPPDDDAVRVLHPGGGALRAGRPVPQPEGHRRRHHAARLDRAGHHRDPRHPRRRAVGARQRREGRDDRASGVARHVRPARAHLRAPATPFARLLHRGEGGRDHDPHDERHRIAPAAAAGRPPAVRAAGPHDGDRHRGAVLLQRRARADHAPPHRPGARRAVAVVPLRVRQGLQPGARRHRRRAERPLREPLGRARGHRVQPGPAQRAAAPQRHRHVPRRQRPHRAHRGDLRRLHRVRRAARAGARCSSSGATWCATATCRSASSPRSSCT